ncbi:stAR-related lipid transfer protein 6 isoform X1 [Balaenoptera acutorostrata]|uniref:StAR-related lipid transfer protein 6 isoform X1 n=1 Tax=Balaenoptera acutorostrata TaxID=9767 RepID=A0ABM3S0M3_BALAC|nr:stAR-related lipid transfer protein 6 isoform X1 [Balaenoptera acutorostrata]
MCEPVYKAGTGYEVRRIQFQLSGVSEKDAISVLVCVYFPLTLWVKISLTITASEYVPAHPMLHHQLLVDFPAYPSSSNYIRGCNHACGHVCSPLQENPAYSKLVMFVQTEMRGKLAPSIIEATMPSNLISFLLNVKDGVKTHKIPSGRGCHHNGHSLFLKKK